MTTRTNHGSPKHDDLLSAVPTGPEWKVDWETITSYIPDLVEAMKECPQDSVYHAEGDVFTHTCMVVECLVSDPQWRELEVNRRARLFWAAVLHDAGKPPVTRHEDDGRITSKGHSRVGASIAREFLWKTGSPYHWREGICGIIMSHQVPFWLLERENPERMAIEISLTCNTEDLCIHARADAKGRICPDLDTILMNVDLAELLFKEANCFGEARPFVNNESRIAYLTKPDRDLSYVAYESHTSEVTMLSGLPGSGKDTWIAQNGNGRPVVSLDDIRVEMGISPTDNQGRVIQEAKERARVHLRAGQDFIWNATNITRNMREPLLALFRDYDARTKIVYVEVKPEDLFEQNRNRNDAVPDKAIMKLIRKLEPPTAVEAHSVEFTINHYQI